MHEVLRDALAELPPGVRVILASRGDPPAAFARLRANGAVRVLGWEALRLTAEESAAIIAQHSPQLDAPSVAQVQASTHGWAAGLILLLEQAGGHGTSAGAPDLASRELVYDYLAGEIFQRCDADTKRFLLHTAYLPQMTVGMAAEQSESDDAARILTALARNNCFLSLRRASPEAIYEYHPMFREFLLERAHDAHSREQRRALQKPAARIVERAGLIEEAVALYRSGQEWEEMARVIAAHAPALLAQGRGETIVQWHDELPPEIQRMHPRTMLWAAASRSQVAPRVGRLLFEKAYEQLRGQVPPDTEGIDLACSGAMDAILYELDDFSLLDPWIATLDQLARQDRDNVRDAAVDARVACSTFAALTLRQPAHPGIQQWIERGIAAAHACPDVNTRLFVCLLAALTLMWTGLHDKAAQLIRGMRELAGASVAVPVSAFSWITLHNVETMYFMLTGQAEACQRAMQDGLELAHSTGVQIWTFQLLLYGYGGALGAGDLARAAQVASQLEAFGGRAGRFNMCLLHYFNGWEASLRRDPMRALQHQKAALRLAVEVGCPFVEVLTRLSLAQLLADCNDERMCAVQLRQLRNIARTLRNRHLHFTCLIGFAQIAIGRGRSRVGWAALRHALGIGRRYAYTHHLGWRPAAMAGVCALALQAGIEVDYVTDLIIRRNLIPEQAPLDIARWPWRFRVHTLGGFRLLREGEPLGLSGKAQRRPLQLLKLLIAHGADQISEELINESMWPRIDGDSAHRSFTSTLHRLRKLLGEERALVLHEGRLSLDRRYFWVDVWALERTLGEVEALFRVAQGRADRVPEEAVERLAERAFELFRGPYLSTDADVAGSIPLRERLNNRFARAMTDIAEHWEAKAKWARAIHCYGHCLQANPLQESFYRQLMACYAKLGRRTEAMEIYQRCTRVLSAGLGMEPSVAIQTLYQTLTAESPASGKTSKR